MAGSSDATFEVEEDPLEVGLIEDLFLLGGAEEQSIATEIVDLAGDALGVVVDPADETVAEELALEPSDAQVVLDVPGSLFEVERAEVVTDSDTLVKRFVRGKAEFVGQVRLTEEDEGEGRKRIHLVVEQETELVKEQRGEQVGLVDDEKDGAAFASQVREGGAELGQEMEKVVGGLGLQSKEDLAIESGDGQMGVGEIDEGKEIAVEGVSKGAQSSGLAGTDVAGDESGEAFL
jgi:hypothetical protein